MNTLSTNPEELQAIILEDPSEEEGGEDQRSRRIAQLRDRHRTMLVIISVALVFSILFSFKGQGSEASLALAGVNLPPICGSRVLLDLPCPGCGLTRSFVAIAAGDFARSLEFHRLGWLVWLAAVLQLPYRIYCLRELRSKLAERKWPFWIGRFLLIMLLANWFLQLLGW